MCTGIREQCTKDVKSVSYEKLPKTKARFSICRAQLKIFNSSVGQLQTDKSIESTSGLIPKGFAKQQKYFGKLTPCGHIKNNKDRFELLPTDVGQITPAQLL